MKYDENQIMELVIEEMNKLSKNKESGMWEVIISYNDENLTTLENIFKEVVIDELFDNENTETIYIKDVLDRITDIYYDTYYDEIWDIRYTTFILLSQKVLDEITKEKNIPRMYIYKLDEGDFIDYLFEEYKYFQNLDFQLEKALKELIKKWNFKNEKINL